MRPNSQPVACHLTELQQRYRQRKLNTTSPGPSPRTWPATNKREPDQRGEVFQVSRRCLHAPRRPPQLLVADDVRPACTSGGFHRIRLQHTLRPVQCPPRTACSSIAVPHGEPVPIAVELLVVRGGADDTESGGAVVAAENESLCCPDDAPRGLHSVFPAACCQPSAAAASSPSAARRRLPLLAVALAASSAARCRLKNRSTSSPSSAALRSLHSHRRSHQLAMCTCSASSTAPALCTVVTSMPIVHPADGSAPLVCSPPLALPQTRPRLPRHPRPLRKTTSHDSLSLSRSPPFPLARSPCLATSRPTPRGALPRPPPRRVAPPAPACPLPLLPRLLHARAVVPLPRVVAPAASPPAPRRAAPATPGWEEATLEEDEVAVRRGAGAQEGRRARRIWLQGVGRKRGADEGRRLSLEKVHARPPPGSSGEDGGGAHDAFYFEPPPAPSPPGAAPHGPPTPAAALLATLQRPRLYAP